jgi:hypothetical protein
MVPPRQMSEDRLDVREANHRMTLATLLALFHSNFSKFRDRCRPRALLIPLTSISMSYRTEPHAVVLSL